MDEHAAKRNLTAYELRIRERLVIDETSPSGLRWSPMARSQVRGKVAGTLKPTRYWDVIVSVNCHEKLFKAHRIVWFLAHGNWPENQIDHINNDASDNRLANLREATCNENAHNKALQANNTSGVKGVTFNKSSGKWMARVHLGGKSIFLGLFTDIIDADQAVRNARERLHGKFANHGRSMTC